MILLKVARAMYAETVCPRGVSDCNKVTLPWLKYVSSLGLSLAGVFPCKVKSASIQSIFCLYLDAINLITFGADALSANPGTTSSSRVGGRSSTTEVVSPAKIIMLPRGAIRLCTVPQA